MSSLPPSLGGSAAHCVLPQQLPQSETEYWQLAWSDTTSRHAKTGLIRCVLPIRKGKRVQHSNDTASEANTSQYKRLLVFVRTQPLGMPCVLCSSTWFLVVFTHMHKPLQLLSHALAKFLPLGVYPTLALATGTWCGLSLATVIHNTRLPSVFLSMFTLTGAVRASS